MPGFCGLPRARKGLIKSLSILGLELEEERTHFNHSGNNNSWATGLVRIKLPALPGTPSKSGADQRGSSKQ